MAEVAVEILVNIDVGDLEAAVSFYERALSLRPARRLFAGEVAEMLGASARIYLIARRAGSLAAGAARRSYTRHWTPVHLDFVVADLDAALAQALAAGALQETAVQEHPWGRLVVLADPFGNGFCLLQFNGLPYSVGAG